MITNAWFVTGGTALYAGHDFAASVPATTLTPLVTLRFVASFHPVAGAAVFLVGTLVVLCAVAIAVWLLLREAVSAAGRPLPQSPAGPAPVRSPRTSIILAELARQRRVERQQRRLKRRQRRHAWAQAAARWAARFDSPASHPLPAVRPDRAAPLRRGASQSGKRCSMLPEPLEMARDAGACWWPLQTLES